MTQEALAAKAEMDRAYISEIERGKASPSVDRLFRVCRALDVRASKILERVEKLSLHQQTPIKTRPKLR